MLQELTIRNFAIIEDMKISFSKGLTVLTGETGAGKSIIISAVNLLLGSRASTALIRSGAEAAELEALFLVFSGTRTAEIMNAYDLDFSEGLFIRRIISQNDKHRIYINGRIATTQMLGAVTENLASISGQHAHQGLLNEDLHLLTIDRFGGLMPLRQKVSTCYHEMLPLIKHLKNLQDLQGRRQEEISLLEFQKEEINAVSPVLGEDETLGKERSRLKHAETLYQIVIEGIQKLYSDQGSATELLTTVHKLLLRAGQIDSDLAPTINRLNDLVFQLEDVVDSLNGYADRIQTDAGQLETIASRLDSLNRLKRKYGGSLATVISQKEHIEKELAGLENVVDDIQRTQQLLNTYQAEISYLSQTLSENRIKIAKEFADKVKNELADLKMTDATFEVLFKKKKTGEAAMPYLKIGDGFVDETGIDQVMFMIAPNAGEPLKPLTKIASGGELSRVMLALMAILAETESVGMVVFDEVDAGIGGVVAEMVGKKIKLLSKYRQVICITHLPQIAKFGDHHYRIIKQIANGRTLTSLCPLDDDARVQEIARMLGGATMTQTTLDHARELLNR
jgi:DNA repair protein RecN (Recombination protein N)